MSTITSSTLIDQLETRVEKHLHKVVSVYQNLDEKTLLKPAANGGWSVTQCLDHLNKYGDYYLPHIQAKLLQPGNETSNIFKGSWIGSYFTKMMEPSTGKRKTKAFKGYIPPIQLDAYAVVARFIQQQELLLEYLNKARQVNLDKLKIPVSIAKFIQLKLGDVFQFLIAHNERHIQQADRNLAAR